MLRFVSCLVPTLRIIYIILKIGWHTPKVR